uniref:Retrotransposon gag domain-containing protein n=1 Tax=Musca domestica TaxID=7370 RepID=A0A1I8NJN2_MUSDO
MIRRSPRNTPNTSGKNHASPSNGDLSNPPRRSPRTTTNTSNVAPSSQFSAPIRSNSDSNSAQNVDVAQNPGNDIPLLLEGYVSTWWQGVQHEAKKFYMAIDFLRKAFSPPKPDWRIFAEITQDKQKILESTDSFICRKRRLFAQLSDRLSEKTMINIIFSQLNVFIREKLSRDDVKTFQDLLHKARDIEMF